MWEWASASFEHQGEKNRMTVRLDHGHPRDVLVRRWLRLHHISGVEGKP
jgi:hypothetical protein